MADFSAADVKRLRDSTGVGMMDAKKALTENDGDFEAATKWLLEKGLAKSAERADRENNEGAVALGTGAVPPPADDDTAVAEQFPGTQPGAAEDAAPGSHETQEQ